MTHVTCRLTVKNRDQPRNPTLGNRVWSTFTFSYFPLELCPKLRTSLRHIVSISVVEMCAQPCKVRDTCSIVMTAQQKSRTATEDLFRGVRWTIYSSFNRFSTTKPDASLKFENVTISVSQPRFLTFSNFSEASGFVVKMLNLSEHYQAAS